jgi:single-strand DNA-binding protein
MNMHQIILLGRATRDSEELESRAKKKFTKFTMAVNEFKGSEKEEETFFYDVLIFGKSAETAFKNIKKGDLVTVMGRPSIDAYISKKDKEAKAVITVIAESWKVLK